MANSLKIAADLYAKTPKNAVPGARWDYRQVAMLTTDLITLQVYAIGVLPAGHRLMDSFVESAQLDSGATPTLTITVGMLNAYYVSPTAYGSYSSGGSTDVTTTPVLVTGQNLMTASTVGQAGGRARGTSTLYSSRAVGVDMSNDRIIAIQVAALAMTAAAGFLGVGICIDQD